jgi:hypothetical protein
VDRFLDRAERIGTGQQAEAARANLRALANQLDDVGGYEDLSDSLRRWYHEVRRVCRAASRFGPVREGAATAHSASVWTAPLLTIWLW